MIVAMNESSILSDIYDSDNPARIKIYNSIRKFLASFPKGTVYCIGKYKNGISMDFCEACSEIGILREVAVPYEDNDHNWPDPIKNKFKKIIKSSNSVVLVSTGGFNPKKIKDMDNYVYKKSDYIINIVSSEKNLEIKMVKNGHKIS